MISKVRSQAFYLSICFFLSPLLALLGIIIEIYNRKKYALFFFSLFLAICAYLYVPNGDLYRYFIFYEQCKDATFEEIISNQYHLDFVIYVLFWFVAKLELGHAFVRFILIFGCSLLYFNIVWSVISLVKKRKIYFCLWCIAFFTFPFIKILTGLRFGTALVFAFASVYNYFILQQRCKGLIFLLLAMLTHFSLFILFPIFFIAQGNFVISRISVIVISICVLLCNELVFIYMPFSSDLFFYSKVVAYTSGEEYLDNASPLLRFVFLLPRYFLLPLFFYAVFVQPPSKLRNLVYLLIIFVCLCLPFSTLAGRYLGLFSSISLLAYLTDFVQQRNKHLRVMICALGIMFILQFVPYYRVFMQSNYSLLLYKPYPFLLMHTYDSNWISDNIYETGALK